MSWTYSSRQAAEDNTTSARNIGREASKLSALPKEQYTLHCQGSTRSESTSTIAACADSFVYLVYLQQPSSDRQDAIVPYSTFVYTHRLTEHTRSEYQQSIIYAVQVLP